MIFADDVLVGSYESPLPRLQAERAYGGAKRGDFLQLKRVEPRTVTASAPRSCRRAEFTRSSLPWPAAFSLSNALVAAGLAILRPGFRPRTALQALAHLEGASGRARETGRHRRQTARRPMSITPTSPRRSENVLSSVRPFNGPAASWWSSGGGGRGGMQRGRPRPA